MGKHVDTIRPVDMTLDGRAREPRHLIDPWGQDPRYTYQRDVWSGDPDTDKAWRDRDEEDAQRYHFPVDEYKYM